ncbi:helix-turn-helix domain-containing protein [Streptomyces cinereoruber]|uniref:helix-turn-helix domain-containing protein n=1 Tax=Streptomyces cinereoruber TaxID=67260 RepID=UPI003C2CFD48
MTAKPASTPEGQLAELVRNRREALNFSLRAVAGEAAISINTWRRLEQGLPIRSHNYAKVETALEWASGSIRLFLDEGKTPIISKAAPSSPGVALATLPEDALQGAVAQAVIAVTDGVTAKQIREISARVLEDLRKQGHLDEG